MKIWKINYTDYNNGVDTVLEAGDVTHTIYPIDSFEFAVVRNVGGDEQDNIIWESDDESLYGISTDYTDDNDIGCYYVTLLSDENEYGDREEIARAYYYYDPDTDSIVSKLA